MNSFLPGTSAGQLRQQVQDFQLRHQLKSLFDENQADVYVLKPEEFIGLWVEENKHRGYHTEKELDDRFREITGYALSAVRDHTGTLTSTVLLSKIAADMHRSGSIFGVYRHLNYSGLPLIAFQGDQRLRKHLTRNIYFERSPQLIRMGIGKAGAAAMMRSGLLLTFVLSPVIRTVDWLFVNQQATIESVIAGVATDMVKAAITGAASYFVMAGMISGAAVGTIAVLPLAAGIAAAVSVGLLVNWVDNHFQLTDRLTEALVARKEEWLLQTEPVRRDFTYYLFSSEGGLKFIKRMTRSYRY